MSKLPNIIQRRELEPLLNKAGKIAKCYEKAANCAASVMDWDGNNGTDQLNPICRQCSAKGAEYKERICAFMHKNAVKKAREQGGSYIYVCPKSLVFWTSPFYSGERFAGALLSGGVHGSEDNSDRVKALAKMMLICADQISGRSYVHKNITTRLQIPDEKPGESEQEDGKNVKMNENNAYLLDLERMLLANLRRGDNIDAKKLLIKLLYARYQEVDNNFQIFRLKALELAVLLSRAVADPNDIKNDTVLETTSRYLNKIEASSSFQEITEILFTITEKMSGKIFSFHGVQHFAALGKAERFIWNNYTKKISLKEIAEASGLSAPYFSTIFKDEMGENLSTYLNRLRVEKSAAMLVTTTMPISEIASACGFEDQSWFSKIFKSYTGFTPGKYRAQGSLSD
uniref:Helix-turn-helix, AraC type n=1 Tax=uncultured bacterium contig00142 TaxID=1181584 RepID=A0A806KPU9_9BACT|nr:helix-turn-helix, AraC type [uncultured bacterium contig00142]